MRLDYKLHKYYTYIIAFLLLLMYVNSQMMSDKYEHLNDHIYIFLYKIKMWHEYLNYLFYFL